VGTWRILFVCTANLNRSVTAEGLFKNWAGVETKSAGTTEWAANPLTQEVCAWADQIFVMEEYHRKQVLGRCGGAAEIACKIVLLGIEDVYFFNDPELVRLLLKLVPPYMPPDILLQNKEKNTCE